MNKFICLALLVACASAFYEEGDDVVNLTEDTFGPLVTESDQFWLIEFYAPWCGHCKKLTPEWKKAGTGLKGMVNMGAVDMTTQGGAGAAYDVQGYPTLKWFGVDKENPEEFEGGRTSTGIIHFATRKLKEIANARIGNKKRAKAPKAEEPKAEEEAEDTGDDDVVVLTDDNFAELVESSSEAWFVEFYAPWCGHCKTLAPVWKKLAKTLKGKVNVAKVDATEQKELGGRFEVKGYPSLKFFPGGTKSDNLVENYDGGRDEDALEQYATTQAALSLPPKFGQLTSQEVYDEFCVNIRGACIVTFLPSIEDSSVEKRQQYIDSINAVANGMRGKPFTFLWSEGGQQYDFEQTFDIGGAGYPAVLAITVKKSKYVNLRGAFSQQNLQSFIDKIGAGKQPFYDFNTKPVVKTIAEYVAPEGQQQEQRNEDL